MDRKHGNPLCFYISNDTHVSSSQWTHYYLFTNLLTLIFLSIAIWERRLVVVVPLLALCLAHWGVLYHGIVIVRAEWDDASNSCLVNNSNSAILKFTFFTSEWLICLYFFYLSLLCSGVAPHVALHLTDFYSTPYGSSHSPSIKQHYSCRFKFGNRLALDRYFFFPLYSSIYSVLTSSNHSYGFRFGHPSGDMYCPSPQLNAFRPLATSFPRRSRILGTVVLRKRGACRKSSLTNLKSLCEITLFADVNVHIKRSWTAWT